MPQNKYPPGSLEALAEVIASQTRGVRKKPTQFRVLKAPAPTLFDSITRNSVLARIRFLARRYGLQFLVEQGTFNRAGLDCLEDQELSDLLKDMETARECVAEGIPLEDADLIRRPEMIWD